jgi:DNA ligase-1
MELYNPDLQYNEIESIVMSEEHKDSDKIQFHILDRFDMDDGYGLRITTINNLLMCRSYNGIVFPDTIICMTPKALMNYFLLCEVRQGEGICFRSIDALYKQGRSTLREQYLVKLSRYIRNEVIVIGFNEARLNSNTEKRDPTGLMRRQTLGANMIGKDTLGSFECKDSRGIIFSVSCGVLTASQRQEIWDNQDKYKGLTMTIKHKPYGVKIKPRNPSFIGWRKEGF